jgi:hypothetical protein
MTHPVERDRELSTGECWDEREAEPIEELDGPEQAAKDAYFQALLEDSFYRQKFNLAPRRIR